MCEYNVSTEAFSTGRYKAVFFSDLPWSFHNRQAPFLTPSWRIVRPSSFCLNLMSQLVFPEKRHPWRRVCVPHRRGELLGLWEDRHLERPEVKTHMGLCQGPVREQFAYVPPDSFSTRLPWHIINFKLCGIYLFARLVLTFIRKPLYPGLSRTPVLFECLDSQSEFVLWMKAACAGRLQFLLYGTNSF